MTPATCCASPPSISVLAIGVSETLLDAYGYPNAGVLFQTSDTVGLLFSVMP